MNAQAQPRITFDCTLSVAQTILDGLAKLPIERAGGIYASLREEIDSAIAKANAPPAPAPLPASPDSTQPSKETQPT